MKKLLALGASLAVVLTASVHATVLTALPGPDDQGGMLMPMIVLSGTTLSVMFTPPAEPPVLASLDHWSPGDTLEPTASWFGPLDPIGGTNDLFNNQYGFTFMGTVPGGKALGLRLTAMSSPEFRFFNYGNSANRFDQVFPALNSQVLWSGSMWHMYATAPDDLAPGVYTATFEVFIANTPFTPGTGFADYSPGALAATQDMGYSTATFTGTWNVVPEPSVTLLAGAGFTALLFLRRRATVRP